MGAAPLIGVDVHQICRQWALYSTWLLQGTCSIFQYRSPVNYEASTSSLWAPDHGFNSYPKFFSLKIPFLHTPMKNILSLYNLGLQWPIDIMPHQESNPVSHVRVAGNHRKETLSSSAQLWLTLITPPGIKPRPSTPDKGHYHIKPFWVQLQGVYQGHKQMHFPKGIEPLEPFPL